MCTSRLAPRALQAGWRGGGRWRAADGGGGEGGGGWGVDYVSRTFPVNLFRKSEAPMLSPDAPNEIVEDLVEFSIFLPTNLRAVPACGFSAQYSHT